MHKLGYEVAAYGSQLQHLLGQAECAEFFAAMPQARRVLAVVLEVVVPAAGILVAPGFRFSGA